MQTILTISEIFQSLQGESSHAGRRCVFIRLSGCDVGCAWCDTRYAASAKEGRKLSVDMILEAIRPYGARLVEITGGEPLMQSETPALARRLLLENYEVLVETSGVYDISVLPHPVIRIMDIKTPSSGVGGKIRWENLAHLRRGDEVKFVIADQLDYEWSLHVIKRPDYPAQQVTTLLSPLSGKMEPGVLADWMVRDKVEARLNLQWHRLLWPERDRGA